MLFSFFCARSLVKHVAAETKESSRNNKPELLDYLIKREANLLERNRDGQIPLHVAVLNENQASVDLILQSMKSAYAKSGSGGDDPAAFRAWLAELVDNNGELPLHYAARLDNLPVALLLISFGFDLSQKTSAGCYAHDLCRDADVRLVLYG